MLIVLSRALAARGATGRLVAAATEMARATRADPGCVSYTFAADVENPDTIVCTEVWTSREALDAHMTHAHTAAFLDATGELLDGEPVMDFHTVAD